MGMPSRIISYLNRNGIGPTFYAAIEHLDSIRTDREYQAERRWETADAAALVEKSQHRFQNEFLISVIVPVFDPDMAFFRVMVASVLHQCYTHFELILSDGGHTDESCFEDIIKSDSRVVYLKSGTEKGISENTNAGLYAAKGDFAAFLDQDDFLEPDALYETVNALQRGADMVYTDEDKFDTASCRYQTPHRKTDFNENLLLSNNYICHFLTVKRGLALRAGGFRKEFDGAQDYDFILRCSELAGTEKIFHVPKILYHWRIHEGSTAGNPGSKLYAYEAGRRALTDCLKRRGVEAAVENTEHLGYYRIRYTGEVKSSDYKLIIDGRLKAMTPDYERILSSYFVNPGIGIVGARIIGHTGKILCNGYHVRNDGVKESNFLGMDTHFSGYMHMAMLQQDTEAVSNHACAVRSELYDCIERDSFRTCRKIRERGYTVVIDPAVVFKSS